MIEGEVDTILSDADTNINTALKEDSGVKAIEAITSPEKVQYLQYLSQYFDIRLRRHFMRRGLALKTSDKQAQVSTDEVHGLDAASWFYPLSKLKAREDGVKMINDVFGTSISVQFSELWAQEYEAYKLRTLLEDVQEQQEADEQKEGVTNEDSDNADGS